MIVFDAGPLIAFVDRRDARHEEIRAFILGTDEPFVLSPLVLAEVDYMLGKKAGAGAQRAFLRDVETGNFKLESFAAPDVSRCAAIVDRYPDMRLGMADASVACLADRHGTRRVATFDERHFRALRTGRGEPFVLLPMDQRVA